jgi:ribosomal protein S18 acetylase RimI-like enzyme
MIEIKEATIQHLESLAPLFDAYRVFYEQQSDIDGAKQFLKDRISKQESYILIAIENDKIVGFTQIYPLFSSVSMQQMHLLNDLFVLPECRGKGIAGKLLDKAKTYAIRKGSKGLSLETHNSNPAQALYERLGWEKDEEYLHYFWKSKSI